MSDKLYAVVTRGGNLKVVSADIVKETKLTVRTTRHGNYETMSAFRYKTLFNKGRSLLHRSPQAALDAFIKDQRATIESAQIEIGDAKRNISEAEKLLAATATPD